MINGDYRGVEATHGWKDNLRPLAIDLPSPERERGSIWFGKQCCIILNIFHCLASLGWFYIHFLQLVWRSSVSRYEFNKSPTRELKRLTQGAMLKITWGAGSRGPNFEVKNLPHTDWVSFFKGNRSQPQGSREKCEQGEPVTEMGGREHVT